MSSAPRLPLATSVTAAAPSKRCDAELTVVVERALRQRALGVGNQNLRAKLPAALGLDNVVGQSPAMAQVFES